MSKQPLMDRLFIAPMLALALACSASGTPPTVDVTLAVPISPTPVRSDQTLLVYELYLERYGAAGTPATRVDVRADGPTGALLKTYEGDELKSVLAAPPAGERDVMLVLIGISLEPRTQAPSGLYHEVTFGNGAIARGALTTVSTVSPVAILPPLQGDRWYAGNAPTTRPVYHRNAFLPVAGKMFFSERFAVDWVQLGADGRAFSGDGSRPSDWYGHGADLLAVADGTITDVRDGVPENEPVGTKLPSTFENLGGNYVVLDIGSKGERFAFYAHMIPGTVTVKIGDAVTTGQVLGKLGNSGNSDAPHLHFHVVNGRDPLLSDGVPYRFDSFQLLGHADIDAVTNGTPWAPVAAPQLRTSEIVAADQVVRLGL